MVQGAALPLLALYLTKLLVDAVSQRVQLGEAGGDLTHIFLLVAAAGGVAITTMVCSAISDLVQETQAQRVTDYIQGLIHAKAIEVDLEYYDDPRYHDTLHLAQKEAPARPLRVVNGLMSVVRNSFSLVAIFALLCSLHWAVALTLFAAVIPGLIARLRASAELHRWQTRRTPLERDADYLSTLLNQDSCAPELRLLNSGPRFIRRFRELRKLLCEERLAMVRRRARIELMIELVGTIAVIGALAFIVYRAAGGAITIGAMIMYQQAFQRGQGYLHETLVALGGLHRDNLLLGDLYRFLDLESRLRRAERPVPFPNPIRSGIVFDHVSFRYPGSERFVLKDVSFSIEPNSHVALVGLNGAGKSTIVKLLCRLYDPTEGCIRIDGIDIRDFDVAALRRNLSVLLQDFVRYRLTARENIMLGDLERPPARESVETASQMAGAGEVIARLPEGYETRLGRWHEGGAELSFGEWQKLALARAFFREAPIVVLDEPASSLDPIAELETLGRLEHLARGKTAIVISHRLSLTRKMNRIFVLDHGRIAESGSHDELMSAGSVYERLFVTQAHYYTSSAGAGAQGPD